MKAQLNTAAFWVSLGTSVVGIATLAFGLTQEQSNGIISVIGAVIALAAQLGFVKAEATVRAAKIAAYSALLQQNQTSLTASVDPRLAVIEAL